MPVPSRPPVTALAAGALLAAALPLGLLVADLAQVFTAPYDEFDVDGFTPPTLAEQFATAVSTAALSPALLTAVVGLLVVAGFVVAGLRVPRPLRVAGVVLAALVLVLTLAAALGSALGARYGFGAGLSLDPTYAVQDAPTAGPLFAVLVLAVLVVVALVRPPRARA